MCFVRDGATLFTASDGLERLGLEWAFICVDIEKWYEICICKYKLDMNAVSGRETLTKRLLNDNELTPHGCVALFVGAHDGNLTLKGGSQYELSSN